MWLFETPEGKEFEKLPDNQKYDFAIGQSLREDKPSRWKYVWESIAWAWENAEQIIENTRGKG